MTQHRVVLSSGGFNFAGQPTSITANSATGINLVTSGTGRSLASSGLRLWDTSIIPANYTAVLSAGQTLTLPLSSANLPPYYFDAIIRCTLNGSTTIIGCSNSPDNLGVYTNSQPVTDKILYWTDLLAFGLQGSVANNNAANHYMFGGDPSSADAVRQYPIYFSEPTPNAVTATYTASFIPQSPIPAISSLVFTGTVNVPAGSLSAAFPGRNFVLDIYNATGIIITASFITGYYKLRLSIADSNYRSVLPFYHWGHSN